MIEALRAERIETWFDLGLMLDRLREDRAVPAIVAPPDFESFARDLKRGVGFVTFELGVDGVSIEIATAREASSAQELTLARSGTIEAAKT